MRNSDEPTITRAQFLVGAAAAAAGLSSLSGRAMAASPLGLTYRGVGYQVQDGETPHTGWNATRMRADMRAIAEDLHASSVSAFGDGVERLTATASEAVEHGLHVWVQPRLGDATERETLDHLAAVGEQAEQLRRQGANVELSVGAEFFLFVEGIVPGAHVLERVERMLDGRFDPVRTQRRLDRFIARAATVGRSVFGGTLSYGAAYGDKVDWNLFDVVSANYYSSLPRRAGYVRELERLRRWGKPVAITEFGTCTYKGAPRRGGLGWKVVDYEQQPPRIATDLVRSERTQAVYITRLLDIFEAMRLRSATIYNFVSPDDPHRRNPRYDLDLASYGIVKPIWKTRDRPTADWHWEPKEAFHAVARHYARAKSAAVG
jgi:hypothetical protein